MNYHPMTLSKPAMSTSVFIALPGKLDIKRHSPVFSMSSPLLNTTFMMMVGQHDLQGKPRQQHVFVSIIFEHIHQRMLLNSF